MENNPIPIDVNHANKEELVSVPGIGPALADRMIGARPFTSLEDLERVPGIGPLSIKPLLPYLTITSVEHPHTHKTSRKSAPPPPEETPETAEVLPLLEPAKETPVVVMQSIPPEKEKSIIPRLAVDLQVSQNNKEGPGPTPPPAPEPPPQPEQGRSIGETLAWAAGTGFLVFILSVAFSLGILALVNGGLSYVPSGQYAALQSRVEVLTSRMDTLQEDNRSLRTRLDNLEALSGRVSSVERETQTLRLSIDANRQELETLKTEAASLEKQVLEVQQRSQTFQRFLDGMRTLLGEVPASTTQP